MPRNSQKLRVFLKKGSNVHFGHPSKHRVESSSPKQGSATLESQSVFSGNPLKPEAIGSGCTPASPNAAFGSLENLSLLKTRPRRLSCCGLRTDPLLERHSQMALDHS